jgi:hypothetical protein
MKTLFIMTALIEGMTGAVFLVLPDLLLSVLIGVSLDAQVGLVIGRLSGAAVLSLSLVCWLARYDIAVQLSELSGLYYFTMLFPLCC